MKNMTVIKKRDRTSELLSLQRKAKSTLKYKRLKEKYNKDKMPLSVFLSELIKLSAEQ